MNPTTKYLLALIVLVAAACGGATGGEPSATPEATVSDTTAPPAPETASGASEEMPSTTDGDGGTFTFEHFAGTTEVPVDAQRIVTLQDQNALLPLLELGVKPVASAALDNGDGTHTFRRVENYDTSGIEFVGAYGEPDLELIATQQPDLIVGNEGDEAIYDELSQIAPTVLISIFDRPLPEALEDFAVLVGRQERHAELLAEYDQNVADLIADLPRPPEQIVLSRVQFGSDGTFFSPSNTQAFGTVMLDVGFARPEAELEAINDPDYSYAESLERLSTRGDADVLITADFSADYGEGGEEDPTIQAMREEPIFQRLDVVQRGEFHVFDGGATVGAAFEKMNNFIEFLRSILVDREPSLRPAG